MPITEWDPQIYRDRALRWRTDAVSKQDGTSRSSSIDLAGQYERLVAILEKIRVSQDYTRYR